MVELLRQWLLRKRSQFSFSTRFRMFTVRLDVLYARRHVAMPSLPSRQVELQHDMINLSDWCFPGNQAFSWFCYKIIPVTNFQWQGNDMFFDQFSSVFKKKRFSLRNNCRLHCSENWPSVLKNSRSQLSQQAIFEYFWKVTMVSFQKEALLTEKQL